MRLDLALAAGLPIAAAPPGTTTGAPPSPEAEAPGVRLARTTGILTVAAMPVEKDTANLAGEDKAPAADERTRVLVAQNENPAAAHFRARIPAVLAEAMVGPGAIDPKKATTARACREMRTLCNRH
jgi:hypothetical protein